MRLFISVNFDERTKQNILTVQRRLKQFGPGRFSRPENFHLTLAFLGEVPEERVNEVKSAMERVTVPRMELVFGRTGCFRRNGGEIWWIGAEENESLSGLQHELMKELKAAGFKPDDRGRFRPHITLAREMRTGGIDTEKLLPQPFAAQAESIHLMLSHRPDGRLTYTELYEAR